MSFNPTGRAVVSPTNPTSFAVCDRCGCWYNLPDLSWQFQWSGLQLINLNILVCETCLDTPAEFLKTLIIPPDPMPVMNARPEAFAIDENDFRITEDGNQRITEDGDDRVIDESAAQDVYQSN